VVGVVGGDGVAYSSISIVITGCKVAAIFWVALLFNGKIEVCLSNVILTVYFLLCKSCSDYAEESSMVDLFDQNLYVA
jgi:hypothetical protein